MTSRTSLCLRGLQIIRPRHQLLHTQTSQGHLAFNKLSESRNVRSTPQQVMISDKGKNYAFNEISLRDACPCARCVDPSTSQKLFDTASIPFTLKAIKSEVQSDGSLSVIWKNDISGYEDHTSVYPPTFFLANPGIRSRLTTMREFVPRGKWNRDSITRNTDPVDYASYMSSPVTLHRALGRLQHYGLLFLSSVPSNPGSVEMIANRIGPIRNSFYGSTWDVRSVPSAKNVAYTSSHLGFHMDLLYCETPPKLQILHCMKASMAGGQSLFSDTFNAIERMELALVESLANFDVTYHYKNDGQRFQQTRRTVEYASGSKASRRYLMANSQPRIPHVKAVNWSPPFQAPFIRGIGSPIPIEKRYSSYLWAYLEAAKVFNGLIEDGDAVFETKMTPGTCVIFDNRRIVHARKAFDGEEGERWLRGAYIDEDAFQSRLSVLNEEFGHFIP